MSEGDSRLERYYDISLRKLSGPRRTFLPPGRFLRSAALTEIGSEIQEIRSGSIYIDEGEVRVGTLTDTFYSPGFLSCSPMVLRSADRESFGLLHSRAFHKIRYWDVDQLEKMRGGQLILVGQSALQRVFLEELSANFGIEQVGTSFFEAQKPGVLPLKSHFSLIFQPQVNEISVLRDAHQDLLVFQGFEQ